MVFTEGDYFLAWYRFDWTCVVSAVSIAFGIESDCQIKMYQSSSGVYFLVIEVSLDYTHSA